jgi:hypothetical protein
MEQQQQPGEEVEEEREAKQRRAKRDRKEYMQKYYMEHKVSAPCPECSKQFSCPRALRHHQNNNYQCLLSRLLGIWDEWPEDSQRIVQLIQEREMWRIRRLVARGSSSGSVENDEKNRHLQNDEG